MASGFDLAARRAGAWLHLTSLPGPHGIGELGLPARQFIDALREMRLGVWQFLPIGPTGYGNSPYQALSSFAGNEMLIDRDNLVDCGLLDKAELAELAKLPHDYVDYGALLPIKTRLLDIAASRFPSAADATLVQAYRDFCDANDALWLHDYSLFRLLKSQHQGRAWPDWATHYASRDTGALVGLAATARARIEAIKIAQFLFFQQWLQLQEYAASRNVALFGDLPIYVAHDSADAWANPDLLRIDADGTPLQVAGVPPDYFSDDGQLWGNPLYDWQRHEQDGFHWWAKRIQASVALVDLLRIDHFRGFESFWAVTLPADTARDGHWEKGPADRFFDAIREQLGDLPIVAEDLGEITAEVNQLRERQQLPGMCVLQFALADPEFSLNDVGTDRVCYTSTHDNDTVVGWFHGIDNDPQDVSAGRWLRDRVLQITQGNPETIHTDMVQTAFSTKASLAMTSMQDLLGLNSTARINIPGKAENNWRWRLREDQIEADFCQNVASLVMTTDRGKQHGH
jgi:4-alpha-glucanotransferase